MRSILGFACVALVLSALVSETRASASYSTAGSNYTQNFDSLPNAGTSASLGNTPLGWTDDNASPGAGAYSYFCFFYVAGLYTLINIPVGI